jgi:TadE-like protein
MRSAIARRQGQAAVELALALPLLLLVVFGLLGAGRLTATTVSVSAVAREAARAGALGTSSADAALRAQLRGQAVAADDGLRAVDLDLVVDASTFGPTGEVRATATYRLSQADVPFFGVFWHTRGSVHHGCRPGSDGQRPPRARSDRAIRAGAEWNPNARLAINRTLVLSDSTRPLLTP